jgi:hypothetical protein
MNGLLTSSSCKRKDILKRMLNFIINVFYCKSKIEFENNFFRMENKARELHDNLEKQQIKIKKENKVKESKRKESTKNSYQEAVSVETSVVSLSNESILIV